MKNGIPPTIRSFLAIELPDEAKDALARLQSHIQESLPPRTVRWTPPRNIHLTLHFLGDVPVDRIEVVAGVLRNAAAAVPSFSIRMATLGCFPNPRRPRILWAGISGETDQLLRLHKDLGSGLREGIGFDPESRPYKPHLTIGRVSKALASRQQQDLGTRLQQEIPKVGILADITVEQVHLIRSDLKPTGAVYTRLADGPLKG